MYKPIFNKREVIVFRQFKRKGYALFACLGREVIISVLSVATLSAAKAASISDETWRADTTQTTKEVWLGDVGVTGSRAPLTQSQAARMVTVLSREEIAQAPVQSVNDLLKYAVGVDVRQRGALGSQTDISIRGGTQEQITVLLNGINVCDAQTAHNVMDLPIQLSDIVRIEVLEGPAGRAYGTSSLVGAINIVTRPDISPEANITLEAGSFGYAKVGASISTHHSSQLTSHLSASYQRSDGFSRSKAGRLNTDYKGKKAFYQGCYEDDQIQLSWHAGVAEKGWGSGTFYASPKWQADEQYEHTTKLFTAIQGDTKRGFVHVHPSIYWNRNYDRYEGYRGRAEMMSYNYNRCDVYGINLNSYFDWVAGRTAFGAELRQEDLVSGNLGEPLFHTRHIGGTDRDYTLGLNRTNASAHLEHNILLDRLTISAGFVTMRSNLSSTDWQIYPGIDVSYQLLNSKTSNAKLQNLKIFAGYNSSLRLPSFTEMYYKLQGYAADPHLKPEEMQAIEVGAQFYSPILQAKACVYHHHGTNMIDWIMDTSQGEEAVWQSVNHTKINATGLEASMVLELSHLFSLNPIPEQSSPTRSLSPFTLHLSYNYMKQDKVIEKNIVSQYALEYLRHKLVAKIQTNVWRNLNLGVGLRWQDRVGSYTTFSGEVKDYRPYALMDARLAWNEKNYSLFAEVNNLLDNRDYVDYGNVPQPGAWIVVGGKYHFNW